MPKLPPDNKEHDIEIEKINKYKIKCFVKSCNN